MRLFVLNQASARDSSAVGETNYFAFDFKS
jgi:hypothetical protein